MGKNFVRNVVFILLLSLTVFSMFKYWSELREKCLIQATLTQAQSEIAVLEQEKQNLTQSLQQEKELNEKLVKKNSLLKDYLKASKSRMTRFFQQDLKLSRSLEETKSKFSVLEAENQSLLESSKQLALENEGFKTKLSSIAELKMAIKELRKNKRKIPVVEVEGNRGFLVKDGQLTTQEKVRIEVVPAQTKE